MQIRGGAVQKLELIHFKELSSVLVGDWRVGKKAVPLQLQVCTSGPTCCAEGVKKWTSELNLAQLLSPVDRKKISDHEILGVGQGSF